MILCKSCDAEVQPGQAFCVNCGARTEGNTYSPGSSDPAADRVSPPVTAATPTPPAPPLAPSPPALAPDLPPYTPPGGYSPPAAPSLNAPSYQPQGYAPAAASTSTMAIVSLVCGLLGWSFFPLLGSIAAVVTGHMGRNEIRASGGTLGGDGMAIAGLVLGYSAIVVTILICGAVLLIGALTTLGSR